VIRNSFSFLPPGKSDHLDRDDGRGLGRLGPKGQNTGTQETFQTSELLFTLSLLDVANNLPWKFFLLFFVRNLSMLSINKFLKALRYSFNVLLKSIRIADGKEEIFLEAFY
jgi:hypothetical protein